VVGSNRSLRSARSRASVFASATTTPARRRAKHPPGAARRAEGRGGGIKRGHDRLIRRREGRNSKPSRLSPGSLPLEAALLQGAPRLPCQLIGSPQNCDITGVPDCCARAASGHAAAPPITDMNSRLFIAAPKGQDKAAAEAAGETPGGRLILSRRGAWAAIITRRARPGFGLAGQSPKVPVMPGSRLSLACQRVRRQLHRPRREGFYPGLAGPGFSSPFRSISRRGAVKPVSDRG
jgi:hypothetical protein